MGGGILQIAANSANDSLFNDQNYTLFKSVYHRYTPFSIENSILNLTSLGDFGKKIETVIPKVGDLLTDIMLVIDLPEISGEYTFTNRDDYLNSLKNQYSFTTMNDVQQYNENLYKLSLGSEMQAYLVRDSILGQYQLILPLLDATMFLIQGKKQKYSLSNFLSTNSEFFDNPYKLHTIKDLVYGVKDTILNIDYLNYAFEDKEFYFFIANLLNIKTSNPNLNIVYFDEWTTIYKNTIKKYILRRPEIIAMNTFIENMNSQITDSTTINNYVFNYENIFTINPLDYQYQIVLSINFATNYFLTFLPYENQNSYEYISTFFSVFNRNYILVKRNNTIIGAVTIKYVNDTQPLNLIVEPFRHILVNNIITTNGQTLYIYYGITSNQVEPINFAEIVSIKNNINNHTEFLLDRSITGKVNDIIIVGINPQDIESINNYNMVYGFYKIIEIRNTFLNNTHQTSLTVSMMEIDQLLLSDTLLLNTNTNITTNTLFTKYNTSFTSTFANPTELVNIIKNDVYTDVPIVSIIQTPITSISENILRSIVFSNDFVLTPSVVTDITNTIQTYISDSYDVLYNYLSNIYYKTIIKSSSNQDYLNNLYFKINYTNTSGLNTFVGVGDTTFTNIENGTFRYKNYLMSMINKQGMNKLLYTNFLTTHILDKYQILADNYNNQWAASIIDIRNNYSDNFVKILNYVQSNSQSVNSRKTVLLFTTSQIPIQKTNLTQLVFNYYKKNTNNNEYTLVSHVLPNNLLITFSENIISFDLTSFILLIQESFTLEYIDFKNSYFRYTTSTTSGLLPIVSLSSYLDNYSNDLVAVINDNTVITNQLYGNNILLDYINTLHETIFGYMKNYESSRSSIQRIGGTKYIIYQEDTIDQTPLLTDGTYLVKYTGTEYYPRFVYSKQVQIYQNIYQKVDELSENYMSENSHIYFINNINYPRTDGYNYKNNNEGPLPYLDPNQLPLLQEPNEYAYNLLDKVSKHTTTIPINNNSNFSFIKYLVELEEHSTSMQNEYAQSYWNTVFEKNGFTTTTINNYISALSGKDDGLLVYYIYKYLVELYTQYNDAYNIGTDSDNTYFKTIYQLSPDVLGKFAFNTFSAIMNTTKFSLLNISYFYDEFNKIIKNNQDINAFKTFYTSYALLPEYNPIFDENFLQQASNMINEFSSIFYYIARLSIKHTINLELNSGIDLSNYPIINKIHGYGNVVKIILASDHYVINDTNNSTFSSSIVYPTGYHINDYYNVFNLSIHYDYLKYVFIAGYGGILRDTEYVNKTLVSFYQKINNYVNATINTVDFAFFYANQTGLYLPNMEGNILQSYESWIQRRAQPYFYYYNTLSIFYDMFFIYSGRNFISEYYTKTDQTTTYNNRPDQIKGELIYATRMAYGTRDNTERLNGTSTRYNLLDQRLYSIIDNLNASNVDSFDMNDDPIQIIEILTILNKRFTDYQEFLVLLKFSININGPYPNKDKYLQIITQFKTSSTPYTDLLLYQSWNSYMIDYSKHEKYVYSSILNGLSTTIDQYNQLSYNILDLSTIGYELHNFMNMFYQSNQRNFSDSGLIKYLSNSNSYSILNDFNEILSNMTYFTEKDTLQSDYTYRTNNYTLVQLDFMNLSIDSIVGVYQSDVAGFKELFKNILNYRQKNVTLTSVSVEEKKLMDDYYSINDVTSVTFYDKFFRFSNDVDYNLIPIVYHELYSIQNASKTIVFYLNYLYSFLSNSSSKPNIADFDNPNLGVSYYFVKYLSSGVNYFLGNFHQLLIDYNAFYPYKSVPSTITLYNGDIIPRPKSYMYLFLLAKIQYRNYNYSFAGPAYTYTNNQTTNILQITGLNMYSQYPDIVNDVAEFDSIIDTIAVRGTIDHLQNIQHPFFVNKHIDNLLFIKDLLLDLTNVSDNASLNIVLENNDKYIEFLSERTIVTNAFDQNGLIFGGYPYTLGVLSDNNYQGSINMIDPTGTEVPAYIEGNIVLPSLIVKIYYYFISECFILNQNELIGSSFQLTPMSLGNTLSQITGKDWKLGLRNLLTEYLFLVLKSKKIIYQNSIYEITYNDLYNRLYKLNGSDRLTDILDMFINSLLKITISVFSSGDTYLGEYEQFKIPADFSLISIKNNFNYAEYYRLMFALRQSLIGKYNNFEERVRFHNAYDYWLENNRIIISDYQTITFNSTNYMIRKTESENIISGLTYYSTNTTDIPSNLFSTIIDYIISNIKNTIYKQVITKYNFKAIQVVKNGYSVALTLYNVYFTTSLGQYNVVIDTGSKTITASVVQGSTGNPFSISYSNLPFGYDYDLTNNKLRYAQLLYQNDITHILENMFTVYQNLQDISKCLSILTTEEFQSDYSFMHFPTFIESFIYYDFTSKIDPARSVNAVVLPVSAQLNVSTLFDIILINWSEFYGIFFYLYSGTNPTAADFLGSGQTIFNNGNYNGSINLKFTRSGKNFISITNALIDSTNPFGSSLVSVNIQTPITVSNISDGQLDTNFAIITIPRLIKITLFGWSLSINISELYTFVSDSSDGQNLTNSAGTAGIADGPFTIEQFIPPNSNVSSFRINTLLTFPEVESKYIYISDKQDVDDFATASVFALIPNISRSQTINIVSDITNISKIGVLSSNVSLLGLKKTYTVTLTNWTSLYQINSLYVYFADNTNGLDLGNDSGVINQPQTYATVNLTSTGYVFTFDAEFKTLGNKYIYLTYNPISNSIPYGSRPVNFLTNSTNPIVTTRITTVTGILNQYIAIRNQQTIFKVTLGNWLPEYITSGISKLYIYTRDTTLPNIDANYIPINNLPNTNYSIVLENTKYVVYFTTTFSSISRQFVYLTFNQISPTYNYGTGLVNIQVTNPPGDLVSFNYIDVIPAFSTSYVANTLTTYTTSLIQIQVNNYSTNYNIYKDIPNLLYIFLSTTNNPANIYSDSIPIVFDVNSILNYNISTTSLVSVYIFVSDSNTYGQGLINFGAGFLNNQIGPVSGIIISPIFAINSKQTNYNIQLTNWNSTYASKNNITSLIVYIGNNPLIPLVTLGEFPITFSNNIYSLIFSTSFSYTEGTYSVYITDVNQIYLKQNLSPTLFVSNQISINTLTTTVNPLSTYVSYTFNGTLNNWKTYFPLSLRLFINKTLNNTIAVNQLVNINSNGSFTFISETRQFPSVLMAFSSSSTYGSGYLETGTISFNTVIGPVNARFDQQSYVLTTKPTNYSVLLPNWDISYGITQLFIYIYDYDQLLWNFGAITISFVDGQYYLKFTTTITGLATDSYAVYISDRNYNVPGYNISQRLTNDISVIAQITLDSITPSPTPFKTYVPTIFTGTINNWISSIFPSTMNLQYITSSNLVKNTSLVSVNSSGVFTFSNTFNTLESFTFSVSDNATYGNGYIETQQLTLSNIIGPVSPSLTTTTYAIKTKSTQYNIILTNWNTSYNISNLHIYLGSTINTPVYTFGSRAILSGANFRINFTDVITTLTSGMYNLYLSNTDPYGIIPPSVNQFISTFSVFGQIAILSITPSPTPFQTYVSTILSGALSNWSTNYPSQLYLYSTIRSSSVTTRTNVTINTDGTFSYTITNNTLPGITLSISDNTTYGSGYIESPVFTLTQVIGPVNASFNNLNFIQGKSLSTTLSLGNWNTSYNINSLYIYAGSNINTSIESYGLKTLTNTNGFKTIFSITSSLTPGTYTLYMSDTDPTVTGSFAIRQAITTQITILSQISISSITTVPTPFQTYVETTFNGTLLYWSATYTVQMYAVFYSEYNNEYYVNFVTVNANGTFTFSSTVNYLGNFKVYISDKSNPVYGNGYYESQKFTLTPTYGPIDSTLTTLYAIKNVSTPIDIFIENWNASYTITSLYVYIGTTKDTPTSVFGLKTISLDGSNYTLSFDQTIGLNAGTYKLYISDTNPSVTNTYLIREQITNQLVIINQIQISSITTTPTPLKTYTSTVYTGSFVSWSNVLPLQLYVFLGKTITNSTTFDQLVSINNSGQFTFTTSNVTEYNTINVGFADTTTYLSGYIKSPFYEISTIIGPTNSTVTPATFTVDVQSEYTITLTNWNSSYAISQLYVFTSSNTSFSNLTLIGVLPVSITIVSNVYKLVFNNTFITSNPYYYVISDISNPNVGTYKIYQTVDVRITNVNLNFTPIVLKNTPTVYNPTNVSNLIIQYDAGEINGTYLNRPINNSNVVSWVNKINTTTYGVSTITTPITYKTSGISNKSSLYFNNNGIVADVAASTFSNGISVFIVFKNISSNRTNLTLFNRTPSGSNFPQPISIYNNKRDFGNAGLDTISTVTSGFNINTSTFSTIFYSNGTSTLVYNESVNGVSSTGSMIYYVDSGTKIHIGMVPDNTSNTNGFIGNISEVLIFNKTLSSTERQNIEGYLAWKWALVTLLPSSHPYSYLNNAFTVPVNGFVGLYIPYDIILSGWTVNPNITSLYVRYNQDINNPTNLVLVGNITITQDESNLYKLSFTVQFSTTSTYYFYITDQYSNIYKTISTPIVITDGSSQITLTSNVSSVDTAKELRINLGGWSSVFEINNVNIYFSKNDSDPSPTFIQNSLIQYSNTVYFVTLTVPYTSEDIYFYVIGTNNNVQIFKRNIMITVNYVLNTSADLSVDTISIFNPKTIPSLTVWLDANQINGTYLNQPDDTDDILTWVDKSGNGYDSVSQDLNPTFSVNGFNNLPAVNFSENICIMNVPEGTFNNGMTVFMVYQTTNNVNNSGLLISRDSIYDATSNPFIASYNTRIIGDGANTTSLTSPVDPSINRNKGVFYANIDSNNYTYFESNLFTSVYKNTFDFWNDNDNGNILYLGMSPSQSSGFFGYISEVLIFNEPITLEQKYNIEGYLAYKWNLQIYLPLYHPYSSIAPVEFTPSLFDTLELWMDASDTNSYTIVNTNQVNRWNDRSPNNYNATYTSGSQVTISTYNTKNVLVFNSVMTINNTDASVANVLAFNPNATVMFLFRLPDTPVNSGNPFSNSNETELFTSSDGDIYTAFGQTSGSVGTPSRGWMLYTVVANSVGSSPVTTTYINGVSETQNTYDGTYFGSFPTWTIGSTNPLVGTLAEMVVFSEALSDQRRVLMEGYLANKWGLQNLLPTGHTYVNRFPNVLDFNNLIDEGIKMNLDASSNDNFTFDANNTILSWIDSSGNNSLSTVSGLGTPTIQTNGLNGKPGVYFNNSSMIPSVNNQLVLNGDSEFSIFTVGYIGDSSPNTNPTIFGSYYSNNNDYVAPHTRNFNIINPRINRQLNPRSAPLNGNEYYMYIRQNTNLLNQLVITVPNPSNPALPYLVVYGPILTESLSNGLQSINSDTKIVNYNSVPYFSSYINGQKLIENPAPSGISYRTQYDTYYTNFYLGGNSADSNSFVKTGYIHKVLVYNKNLDAVSRIKVEGSLALNWNVNTINPYVVVNRISAFKGIPTKITIILENLPTGVTSVYLAYNLSPTNLTNSISLGPFTIQVLNNRSYISTSITFTLSNTYYFHIVSASNLEYAVCSKTITVSDISISTASSVFIIEGTTYTIPLLNWSTIVNTIGLYSKQIIDFDLYIGISNTDPSPVFVTNVPISYINNNYVLSLPGLTSVNLKYLFFRKTINSILVSIPPILINSITLSSTLSPHYGFIDANSPFTVTMTSNKNPFSSTFSSVYVYYSTVIGSQNMILSNLTYINSFSVVGNTVTFTINTDTTPIGFYISTGPNYTGYTFFTDAINLIDYASLSANLDTYDVNTNQRNILLPGWSALLDEVTSIKVFSGSAPDYSGQTLLVSPSITLNSMLENMTVWLDASESSNFIFNDDTFISEWIDKSGKNTARTTSYPIYNRAAKGVAFDTMSYFNLSNGTIPHNNQEYSIFIVITPDSRVDRQFIIGSTNDIDTFDINETNIMWTQDNKYIHSFNDENDLETREYEGTNKQLISIEYDSSGRITRLNGEINGRDSYSIMNESSMYNNLLGGLLHKHTFTGLIHELIICNNKISNDKRQEIQDYLNTKWSIY
jgi:hypothetical protein